MRPEAIIAEEVSVTNSLNKRSVDDDTDFKIGGNACVSGAMLLPPSSPSSMLTQRFHQQQKRSKHGQDKMGTVAGLTTPPFSSAEIIKQGEQSLAASLFSSKVVAKIWGVAQQSFSSSSPPTLFPEYTEPGGTKYVYRELDFWTSGFFPGCLYLLLERRHSLDNMMNLDVIFWAASQLGDDDMWNAAVKHAETTREHHIRPDSSTFHVVNFDQATGVPKEKITNQGYSDTSSWSRGQAWAIAGFAQTYGWTRDRSFLDTAISCADYFLEQLPSNWIPPWDFAAPKDMAQPPDVSAAMIAAYGMLLIHEALTALGRPSTYLRSAIGLIRATCNNHINSGGSYVKSRRSIDTVEHGTVVEEVGWEVDMGGKPETILNGATINNYEFAPRRWANHGLVYADYFFLLVGNKLLEMGVEELFDDNRS
ncbi:uncharacterized protein N0V96_010441 [Colletotrichum fioriniae]|uniref:uncharacterized protein n=1 Tax=Colletotrichum fioriniae TaxID=710243 RepID=UPI0032DA79BB|nr:hypothetical protein N0V96_010441 [Colletotrichum fioriniae]